MTKPKRPPASQRKEPEGAPPDLSEMFSHATEGVKAALASIPENIKRQAAETAAHIVEFSRSIRALEDEAEALFEAIDDADLPTIERYVREHPPSSGAIGFLVLIAQDRYKSKLARTNAMRRAAMYEPAREFVAF